MSSNTMLFIIVGFVVIFYGCYIEFQVKQKQKQTQQMINQRSNEQEKLLYKSLISQLLKNDKFR
jgi:uncharacterized membrane protein